MKPIIKIKNLDFTYNRGKDNEYQALINVSLEIYPEEFIIVFGPSGCGKSTLLHSIAGLEKPESGTIEVFGKELTTMTNKESAIYHRVQVGLIYQQYNLITSLTVLDNVALPQIFVNVRRGKRNKWARDLLQRFGILKHAKKIPTELSGGQMQRIGIARAIVNNPKIVLADEPVGNLDSISAKNVLDILENLNQKEKKTVIMVTHNPENLNYGDRIIYMKDGIITREVINRDKRKGKVTEKIHKPKTTSAELEDLMRAYHGLAPEQINILIMPYKAKAFAHHFISSRNLEETKVLEEVIQRRLMGTISQEEFFDTLHISSMDGGVGFDIRTAEKIIRRVNRIIRTAYFVYQKERQHKDIGGQTVKITDEEKSQKLCDYLLKTCYHEYIHNLDEVQINRITQAVKDRMTGMVRKDGFFKFLDKPFTDGGVGLNRKTARAMSEELELILVLGFGIVQTTVPTDSHDRENDEASPVDRGRSTGSPADTKDSLTSQTEESLEVATNENESADKTGDNPAVTEETKPAGAGKPEQEAVLDLVEQSDSDKPRPLPSSDDASPAKEETGESGRNRAAAEITKAILKAQTQEDQEENKK